MLRSAGRTKAIAGATLLVATLVLVAPASVASARTSAVKVVVPAVVLVLAAGACTWVVVRHRRRSARRA